MKAIFATFLFATTLVSCANSTSETATTKDTTTVAPAPAEPKADFSAVLLGYKNDPVCEMPVKNTSIDDTINYKGKIIGFCNKSCKDEFVKSPESYVAVLKKGE
jgi:YHS domain-containing protein